MRSYALIRKREWRLPFCASMLWGLAAHMFVLTNKIPISGEAGRLFSKGSTVVSGRWGLALTSYIMPDASMSWINGLMSLLLISVAICVTIELFDIKSKPLQVLLSGLLICAPAESATLTYMFTCAPYALSVLLAVSSAYMFERGGKCKWLKGGLLLVLSCSIYQGYFGFASGYCVIILIKELMESKKSVHECFLHALKLFAALAASAAAYGGSAYLAGLLTGIPLLNVFNSKQGILMRIAVAYSAYIKTFLKGYFAYVNTGFSAALNLLLILASAASVLKRLLELRDLKRAALLLLCIFLFPLSCYCVYLLADNGYIHSLALYPFFSVYVLFAVILENYLPEKPRFGRAASALAMAAIIIANIFFANKLYLCIYLEYTSRVEYYTAMISTVMQTEGFDEGKKLALTGEASALEYDIAGNFDLSGYKTPDYSIKDKMYAEGIIHNILDCDIPFASEEEVNELEQSDEVETMPVYPYYGSVKQIGDYIVVKLDD